MECEQLYCCVPLKKCPRCSYQVCTDCYEHNKALLEECEKCSGLFCHDCTFTCEYCKSEVCGDCLGSYPTCDVPGCFGWEEGPDMSCQECHSCPKCTDDSIDMCPKCRIHFYFEKRDVAGSVGSGERTKKGRCRHCLTIITPLIPGCIKRKEQEIKRLESEITQMNEALSRL